MAAGCPAKCAKFLLIAFNIIFWLSGAALLAVGIWLILDKSVLAYFEIINIDSSDEWFNYAAYVLIAVGAFTFITGFAGCCGAIRESPCLLGVYIFLLVVVMLVEIAAGVLAFVFRNKIEDKVEMGLKKTFLTNNLTESVDDNGDLKYTGFGVSMNLLQQQFDCCGVNGSADYENSPDSSVFDKNIPYSCCKLSDGSDNADPQKDDVDGICEGANIFPEGCQPALKQWLEEKSLILIGLGIGIACLELFGIIFAVCLCRNPSSDEYK